MEPMVSSEMLAVLVSDVTLVAKRSRKLCKMSCTAIVVRSYLGTVKSIWRVRAAPTDGRFAKPKLLQLPGKAAEVRKAKVQEFQGDLDSIKDREQLDWKWTIERRRLTSATIRTV